MTDNTPSISQEITDLRNRMNWLDEERRKSNRRIAELDQRVEAQGREIETRDSRIQKLEEQLAAARNRLRNVSDIDVQFAQVRKELIGLINQVDDKRQSASSEIDRMRTIERQITTRELNEMRKELPQISRLSDQIEQRKSEETRLQQQISTIQNTFPQYDTRIDKLASGLSYAEETIKQLQRQASKLDVAQSETGKRIEVNRDQLSSFNLSVGRMEASMQESARTQLDDTRKIREWLEQAKTADYERTQRVATWQTEFEQYKQDMQNFHQDYLRMADQAREARALVQSLDTWRKQIELQQREASELNRVEAQRVAQQWENFRSENEKFWSKVDVDMSQRQGSLDRRLRELTQHLHDANEKLSTLEQEKDTLNRIQTAQADALQAFPRLWLEEVEKAIANDPNRRRSAAAAPTPDET